MSPVRTMLAAALAVAAAAQTPSLDNAGYGSVYRDVVLDAQTGNTLHLGVAVADDTGHAYVSATGVGGAPPHLIYEFDAAGVLVGSFPQPSVHDASPFGIRDLDTDGQSLIGGSELGLSVFDRSGQPVNVLLAQNGPQAIAQPITGQARQQLGTIRAVAFDAQGNGGAGSLFVASFGTPILEVDLAGAVLRALPNRGWSTFGLALDPRTRNLWVNADLAGAVVEVDRVTGLPTGHSLRPVVTGLGVAAGGLSLASTRAGFPEPWPTQVLLAQIQQAPGGDHLVLQRVHLRPDIAGWDEPELRVGRNGGPFARTPSPFRAGDVLTTRLEPSAAVPAGTLCWSFVNFYGAAATDAYTDFSVLQLPGIMPEFRALTPASVPAEPVFGLLAHGVGTPVVFRVPATLPVRSGDLLRVQSLYLQPSSPFVFAASNEAHWIGTASESGIVVAASGPDSLQGNPANAFWSVTSDTTHLHGDILAVELSFVGALPPAAGKVFDIDQVGMADRFDGGNSSTNGCQGTYRGNSAADCGLDFTAPGVHVDPLCHTQPGESGGFVRTPSVAVPLDTVALRFVFTSFTPGKVFRFDCDTDGGLPSGDQHAGMIVRVVTSASGTLSGALQVDPSQPDRAVVWFP